MRIGILWNFVISSIFVVCKGQSPSPTPSPSCTNPAGWNGETGTSTYIYQRFGTALSWSAAETACRGNGGYLASFRDATQITYISGLGSGDFWIGLYDSVGNCGSSRTCSTWTWDNPNESNTWIRSATGQTYWRSGEPNGTGDCVRSTTATDMRDTDCASAYVYICEKLRCPSSSPTPTSSTSSTPSFTPTTTRTPSLTPSLTSSPSTSPSNTRTPSLTPSITPSTTASPSDNYTPSITPTQSITETITPTPTLTASSTNSATCSPSVTPSFTSTITTTITATTTPSVTSSSTNSPSQTTSQSASLSATSSRSVTVTSSITSSSTPTTTMTPSITTSVTPSVSTTASTSITTSPTTSVTSSISGTPTTTETPSQSRTPSITSTASITNSPSVSTSSTPSFTPVVTTTPSFSRTPSVSRTHSISSTLSRSPSSSLTRSVTPTISLSQSASITSSTTASITASTSRTTSRSPSISVSSTISNSATISRSLTPSMSVPLNDSFALFPPTQTRILLGTDKFAIFVVHMSTSFLGVGIFLPITLYQGFYKKDYALTKQAGVGTFLFSLGSAITGFLLGSFGSLFDTAHGLAVITLFCGFCMILLKVAIGTFEKRENCIRTAIQCALLIFSLFAELTGFITMPLGSYTLPIMIAFASYHMVSIVLFFYGRRKHSMHLRVSLPEKKESLVTFIKHRQPTQFEIGCLFKKVEEQKESKFSVSNPLYPYFSQKSKEQFRLKKLSEKNML